MNLIQTYFRSHDTRYLERAKNPQKNRSDIKMFHALRVSFLLATVLIALVLLVAIELYVAGATVIPEFGILILGISLGYVAIIYTWVTEALLFRRFIEDKKQV